VIHQVLLVVDAMTGQEAATVTARFNDDIGITGVHAQPRLSHDMFAPWSPHVKHLH
jgi:hypothetical protein